MSQEFSLDPRLARFPRPLRQLLEAELAVGNAITEVASCFPAPPAGAYVKLARLVSTRVRAKTAEVDFYERNSSLYSGEWTDAQRFYFVLEPPHPPPPEPDMDAIRCGGQIPRESLPAEELRTEPSVAQSADEPSSPSDPRRAEPAGAGRSAVQRFRDSMIIDYEKWHDGIGYDLEALNSASPAERKVIEALVLGRNASDWRDIEALAALKTVPARRALKQAMARGNLAVRGAVIRHAAHLISAEDKREYLLQALRSGRFYHGLSEALDEVAKFHPPEIVDELLRGSLERSGEVAVHFAAMLMFIHGRAKNAFDWDHRPFYLRFRTEVRAERAAAFRDLCGKIGVDAGPYLERAG